MKYGKARELIAEAARRSNRSVSSGAKARMDKWHEDLMSGKATKKMLNQIKKHQADAVQKKQEELALAEKHRDNKIRLAHHMMRADHFATHAMNYERHYGNAKKAHDMGNYRRASAEGSHAATGPHLRDVPHHVDYHVASYYDKK